MNGLWSDLRFSARMLWKTPGSAAVAILTLALGIGANTAIFSVVNGVLLRPLPYPEPQRLVQVWDTDDRGGGHYTINPVNFRDWRERNSSFEELATYRYANDTLIGDGDPQRLLGARVSKGFFRALGVPPQHGRTPSDGEDEPGGHRVVVLSHGLWERSFAADPDIVGRTINLNGETFTVVGVMPPGFHYPRRSVELWRPLALDFAHLQRGYHYLLAMGRLRSGVDLEQARADMDSIARQLEQEFPDFNTDLRIALVPMHEQVVGDSRPALLVLMAAVALVMLTACANVTNLLLSRATDRGREVAIRTALGAGRLRLVRQFLVESMLLALIGGVVGFGLAVWGTELIGLLSQAGLPRTQEIGVDARVLGFTLLASLLAGLAFGIPPALHASRVDLNRSLKEGNRGGGPAGRLRMRSVLVVAEVALALVLVVGGLLLIRSFVALRSVPAGLDPSTLVTMRVSLPDSRYAGGAQRTQFYGRVLERIASLPGVQAVGATQELPFGGSRTTQSFEVEGRPASGPGQTPHADYRLVSAGYLRAVGLPLVRGRGLEPRDVRGARRVALINRTMAGRFWPDEEPLGQRILVGEDPEPLEIVGVVGDVRHSALNRAVEPEMYVPYSYAAPAGMDLAVRSAVAPESLHQSIRAAVGEIDAGVPVYGLRTMEERIAGSIAPERVQAMLLGGFAAGALLLAAVGVYGVLSFAVAQRTREIGIRMALGARTANVLRMVAGQGLRLVLIGIGVGLAGALAATRLLSSLLFGVQPTDPATFAAAAALLTAAALVASLLPARRATRVDPMVALRQE